MDKKKQKTKYNTWIRKKRIAIFSLITFILILASFFLLKIHLIIGIICVCSVFPFAYIVIILLYSYYQFSEYGNSYQSKIHDLIVGYIKKRTGCLLEIGTGSASLIIRAAKILPNIIMTGIDYWSNEWEYSQNLCEKNAQIEGVGYQINFVQASASKLPFENNKFDIIISCLTFHEVKDTEDKILVLKEAFRTLKKGGEFIFLDLFLDKNIFGEYSNFINAINTFEFEEYVIIKLNEIILLPKLLLNKNILGNAAILKGTK